VGKLKRIGLYGISGTGKTTVIKGLTAITNKLIWLEGSKLVLEAAGSSPEDFRKLPSHLKYKLREKAIEKAFEIQKRENKDLIIDGHVIFATQNGFENAMTEKDKLFYTEYIYLMPPVGIVHSRLQADKSRKRNYSIEVIEKWMAQEVEELRSFCIANSIPIIILDHKDSQQNIHFIHDYIKRQK
jgi:adenylate kinase